MARLLIYGDAMSAENLSAALWRERACVQRVAETICPPSYARFAANMDTLRVARLYRDVELLGLFDEWNLTGSPHLGSLIGGTLPEPWGAIFTDHGTALRDLVLGVTAQLVTASPSTRETWEAFISGADYG